MPRIVFLVLLCAVAWAHTNLALPFRLEQADDGTVHGEVLLTDKFMTMIGFQPMTNAAGIAQSARSHLLMVGPLETRPIRSVQIAQKAAGPEKAPKYAVLVTWSGPLPENAGISWVLPTNELFYITPMPIPDHLERITWDVIYRETEPNSAAIPDPPQTTAVVQSATAVSQGSRFWHVLGIGFEHILPSGLDHILFVLGLYLGAQSLAPLLLWVTTFTVAHSLTLGLTWFGLVGGAPWFDRLIEIVIALSIVALAVENTWLRSDQHPWRRSSLLCGFGLIHGLGFAGALGELDWGGGSPLLDLLAANLGIELGQLVIVGAAAALTAWAWQRPWYRSRVIVPASAVLGCIALWWTVQRCLG